MNAQYKKVDSVNQTRRSLTFERGGYQHGRDGPASSFWIENQLELLDAPGEWWLDIAEGKLYLYPNSTALHGNGNKTETENERSNKYESKYQTPPASSSSPSPQPQFAAAVLETVVAINGTSDAPVVNVNFHGIGFGLTAPTYLRPYERPISGDWAIHRVRDPECVKTREH